MATTWRAFVVNTTVHGLRYVYESSSRIFRIMWLILLVTAVTCHVFFALLSFAKYFSNPVITESTEIVPANGELVFPAVTICNLNRFVKRKINMLESEGDFYKLGLNLSACEAIKKVNKDMTCGQGLLCAFELFGSFVVENCNDTIKSRIISVLNNTKEPSFNPEEFLSAYGHDFRDMLPHYCRFAEVETCSLSDFYPLLVQKGRCFTFNSGRNGTKIGRTRRTGSSGGLGVFLDTQVHENTTGEFSHGLRVIVHEQGIFENLDSGFNVFPGSHTLVRVTAIKRERLPHPYKSNCTKQTLPRIPRYSRDCCYMQCLANKTLAKCGCRMIGIPVPSNLPVCTFQHKFCEEQTIASYNSNDCSCGLPCTQLDYTTHVSYSQFPDDGIRKALKHLHSYNETPRYQRENLAFLQVGLKYHGYSLIAETPNYKMESLLGDVGGNMGLFLGCSLLSLFEFIELFWNILRSQKYKDDNTVEDRKDPEHNEARIS